MMTEAQIDRARYVRSKNRTGNCDICGNELDYYEGKWIERLEPHRIACLIHGNVGTMAGQWQHYTDG